MSEAVDPSPSAGDPVPSRNGVPAGVGPAPPPIVEVVVLSVLLLGALGISFAAHRTFLSDEALTAAKVRLIGFSLLASFAALLAGLGYFLGHAGAALARLARGRPARPARVALAAMPLAAFVAAQALSQGWLWQVYRALVITSSGR